MFFSQQHCNWLCFIEEMIWLVDANILNLDCLAKKRKEACKVNFETTLSIEDIVTGYALLKK